MQIFSIEKNNNTEWLKMSDLTARFGNHRCSIYRWIKKYDFPKPVKLSEGCSRWKSSDVEAWEKTREN
jgi:prophage regulatory protein